MRELDRKRTAKSAARSRVRFLIKSDLWWLTGFPVGSGSGGVLWMSLPVEPGPRPMQVLHLEREHLRLAISTSKFLFDKFPRALPATVGDTVLWRTGIERLVELLEPAVHGGAPLAPCLFGSRLFARGDAKEADRMRAAYPRLGALLDALSWRLVRDPPGARAALGWVAAHANELQVLLDRRPSGTPPEQAVAFVLRLHHVSETDGPATAAPLVLWLGDPRIHEIPLHGSVQPLSRALEHNDLSLLRAPRPAGTLGPAVYAWGEKLLELGARTRRHSISLFLSLRLESQVRAFELWWNEVDALSKASRRLWSVPTEQRKSLRKQLLPRLADLRRCEPLNIDESDLFTALLDQAGPGAEGRFRALLRALEAIPESPEGTPSRSAMLIRWNELAHDSKHVVRLGGLLHSFGRYLRDSRLSPQVAMVPWIETSHWSCDLEECLLAHVERDSDLQAFFAALAKVQRQRPGGIGACCATALANLVSMTHDSELAARLCLRLAEMPKQCVTRQVMALALELCLDRPDDFGRIAHFLGTRPRAGCEPQLLAMARALRDAGFGTDPIRLLLEARWRSIFRCALALELLKHLHVEAPPLEIRDPAPHAWTARYPEPLRGALERLAGLDPAAESTAARILEPWMRDDASRRSEVEMLRARLAGGGVVHPERIVQRLQNLERQLGTSAAIPASRLQRLHAKIERTWAGVVLDAWEARIDSALRTAFGKLAGTESVPQALLASEALEMVLPLMHLEQPSVQLALRLLARRAGPPPWDLHDDPANRGFLARMQQRGLDLRPWLDGFGIVERSGPNGRRVQIVLENDPLEIFAMGAHFRTCLRPWGSCNESVIANAADINKRVLYARDERGAVIGRCLLALTDEGALVSFHPYCHDAGLAFGAMVRDVALDLAARMGTIVSARGQVSELVARTWYDDGPEDLSGSFECFLPGSALRTKLAEVDATELVRELEAALAPRQLDERTLPMVLGLAEIEARPELACALAPHLVRTPAESAARMQAAALLERAGALALATRMYEPIGVEAWLEKHDDEGRLDEVGVRVLLRTDPAGVLRVLRSTRERGVRRFRDEPDSNRLHAAAVAHDLLARPRQALELYELAAKHWDAGIRDSCKQRAAELRAQLGSGPARARM